MGQSLPGVGAAEVDDNLLGTEDAGIGEGGSLDAEDSGARAESTRFLGMVGGGEAIRY